MKEPVPFKVRIATLDGFHPKGFAGLSTQCKDVLADMLNLFEDTGMWPTQNSSVHMNVQRKPGGGFRLIGWYRALFRLWCAIRSEAWRGWEDRHASETFFSASKGCSVTDVGWRQVVRAEVAAFIRQSSCTHSTRPNEML